MRNDNLRAIALADGHPYALYHLPGDRYGWYEEDGQRLIADINHSHIEWAIERLRDRWPSASVWA